MTGIGPLPEWVIDYQLMSLALCQLFRKVGNFVGHPVAIGILMGESLLRTGFELDGLNFDRCIWINPNPCTLYIIFILKN